MNWYVILFPFCYNIYSKGAKKIAKFNILVNYVMRKLCIKEIIRNSNEVEKIKLFMFDTSTLNIYENTLNHLPVHENQITIWSPKQREIIFNKGT